jgi:hypothetical protein
VHAVAEGVVDLNAVFLEVFGGDQEHIFDEASEFAGFQAVGAGAREPEHTAGDGGGALGPVEDFFEGLALKVWVGGAEAELGVAEDGGEGVVELVDD